MRFKKHPLDINNKCEVCSVFDVDNNGIPDIVCGEYWYEGPDFNQKHKICDIHYDGNYLWDFSDFPLDVDGDGYLDIITGFWFDEWLYWRQNPGKAGGEWKTHKIMPVTNLEAVLMYDIDGDGRPEIFPNCPNEPAFFLKLLVDNNGKGTGKFEKHVMSGSMKAGHGLGIGDIDNDGFPEIILRNGILHMRDGNPYGDEWMFLPGPELPVSASVPILVYDVNGDGKNDIIAGVGHGYGLFWYEQNIDEAGVSTWKEHVIDGAWSQYHTIELADLDNDGVPELVAGKRYKAHNGRDPGEGDDDDVFICYYKMQDGGFYRHIIDYGKPNEGHSGLGQTFAIADLDGKGALDIVAPGKLGLYLFKQNFKGGY